MADQAHLHGYSGSALDPGDDPDADGSNNLVEDDEVEAAGVERVMAPGDLPVTTNTTASATASITSP